MEHVAEATVNIDRIKHVHFNGLLKELWVKLWLTLLHYDRILECLPCLFLFLQGFLKNYFFVMENFKHKGTQNSE